MVLDNKNNIKNNSRKSLNDRQITHARNLNSRNTQGTKRPMVKRENSINNSNNLNRKTLKPKSANNTTRPNNHNINRGRMLSFSLNSKKESDFNRNRSFLSGINDKTKKIILIILISLVVLGISFGIGTLVFFITTSSKMSISDDAKSSLTKQSEGQPFYNLFSIEPNGENNIKDNVYLLVRTDPTDKQCIFISIPPDTYVPSSTGGGTTLGTIYAKSNDSQFISAVASFAEVGISHYFKFNADGIKNIINLNDGITVNLKESLDDPLVGKYYIPEGTSHISGDEAIALLRSKKSNDENNITTYNQRAVAMGMAKSITGNKTSNIPMILDQQAGNFKCDMSAGDCMKFIETFKNLNDSNFLQDEVPGYSSLRNNEMVFLADATEWKILRTQVNNGAIPTKNKEKTINDISPKSFTIQVKNGSGISGAAAYVENLLNNAGYKATNSGNAESNAFEDTLIIYKGESNKDNAEAIKNTLRCGRIVNGEGKYDMKNEILIMIGTNHRIQ